LLQETVVVSQTGARMHYAVPRILNEMGKLERLYTDVCAVKDWPRMLAALPKSIQPGGLRRLSGRIPLGISPRRITAFSTMGFYYVMQRMRHASRADETRLALLLAERFSKNVVRSGFGSASGFYGIAGECLEQLISAKQAGLWTIVEQIIAPRQIVDRLVEGEARRFPQWGSQLDDDPFADDFANREKAEWAVADVIICPSEFVRQSVEDVGGPAHKCVVVPYGIDYSFEPRPTRTATPKLRVVTVGAVGLRKGSPYVLEAARLMGGKAEFRMVGPIGVSGSLKEELGKVVDLRGVVPRAEVRNHYDWADVFLLPTVCEGSATVTYEALAAGLPVVTTPNAGSVVRSGMDGFVVPLGDTQAIVEALTTLHRDRAMLTSMSVSARIRAADYDLASYRRRLQSALALAAKSPAAEMDAVR
jgi:glycosyltransferase involved in cell wall biosynthesis